MKELVAKPSCSQSNIIIRDSGPGHPEVLVADFGSACLLATPAGMPDEGEERGTPSFMAPELLLPTKFGLEKMAPSKEADVYAFGVTMYQVLTGKRPFRPVRKAGIIRAVISGERPTKPENAEEIGMTDSLWNLLRDCWKEDRKTRPNIHHVVDGIDAIVYPPTPSPIPSLTPSSTLSPIPSLTPSLTPSSTPSPLHPRSGVFRRLLRRMSGPAQNRVGDNKPS